MQSDARQTLGVLVCGRFAELEDALVARVGELRAGHQLAPLTLVVGSAALRTHIGDLLTRRLGALAGVSVVTLARLAADLAPGRHAGALVRERIMHVLIAERSSASELRYFAPVCALPHVAQAFARTFDDLRQAGVAPRTGWAQCAAPGKAADLEALYAAYCAALDDRGLTDDGARYFAAAASLGEGVPPRGSAIGHALIYGLYDLNVAQEAFVGALLAGGADMFVPRPRAGGTSDAPALCRARSLGLGERKLELPSLAGDLAAVAAALRPADEADEQATAGASNGPALTLSGDGGIAVVSVPDERAEAREAVREILRSLAGQAEGAAGLAYGGDAGDREDAHLPVQFWDCAVVVPHADELERFSAALAAAGVPVAARRPDRALGSRTVVRLLDCLAPVAGRAFARAAVVDLLTSAAALPRIVADEAPVAAAVQALWLDEARRAGVVAGVEQWTERIGRRRYGLERRLQEIQSGGGGDPGDEIEESSAHVELRLAAAASLEAAVGDLARACRLLPARASWATWTNALTTVVERAFPGADVAALRDAVQRLHVLGVVGEQVAVREVAAALREQCAGATVGEGRVGRDGVALLTPMQLRGLRFHTVVFTGLAEGGFPARGRPDPLYGDAERLRTSAAVGVRLPLAATREAEEDVLFALAVESARERLVMLAPRTDAASGRPRLPSRVLLSLATAAGGHAVGLEEFLSGAPLRPVWRYVSGRGGPRDPWIDARERDQAELLATGVVDEAAASEILAAVLTPSPNSLGDQHGEAAAHRRLSQWRAARSVAAGVFDGLLGPAARDVLRARRLFAAELHPTRLERYVGCPFVFYVSDVLGLAVPEEPGDDLNIDPREFGTLAHKILQRVYAALIAAGGSREDAMTKVHTAWSEACAEAEQRGVVGSELAWTARRQALREDLLETVARDPIFARSGERVLAVEWAFGESEGRSVSLALADGREVRFAGRVDRVDATRDGARVIDYKTGAGAAEEQLLKAGLGLQLPVYRLAVRRALAQEVGDGEIACLYRMVTRRGSFDEHALDAGEEASGARLRLLIGAIADLVEAGVFARSAADQCSRCDLSYACGASEWTRARKRHGEALAAVVALQSGKVQTEEADDSA
ncbi:MAG: PD-(D/E)XK nuclease family protein [Thermoleophilia bacterium]